MIDRFTDSTIEYQHYGFGIDIKLINTINNYILKDFNVDYTFLNIVNKNNMLKRMKSRKSLNRYDKFKVTFIKKFKKFYKISKKKYEKI